MTREHASRCHNKICIWKAYNLAWTTFSNKQTCTLSHRDNFRQSGTLQLAGQ